MSTSISTASPHVDALTKRYPSLSTAAQAIDDAIQALIKTFSSGNKLLIAGNGGSCADADHLAAELLKGFIHARQCPNTPPNLEGALPAIPLGNFHAFNTAFANDRSADFAFAQLVHALGSPGDTLLAISTSGKSPNILNAIQIAHERGLSTIALTGTPGGPLASQAHITIKAPESETFKIQELHLPIYHTLAIALEEHFFPNAR